MSETKWTPGPWEYRTDGDRHYVGTGPFCIVDEAYATSQAPDRGAKERKSNAHLIAAAPDLYEALEQACNIIAFQAAAMDVRTGNSKCSDGCSETLKEYGRLLAKARGEALIDQQPGPESDLERDRR